MCARFYVPEEDAWEDLEQLLRNLGNPSTPLQAYARGEVKPSMRAGVIALNRQHLRASLFPMAWGYPFEKKRIINARFETAAQKPMFRDGWEHRRCLIPMASYFEWDHRSKPFRKIQFTPKAYPMTLLCGLYRLEPGSAVFTVLTRPAAASIAQYHDRMPVIVPPEAANAWLDPHKDPLETLETYSIQDVADTPADEVLTTTPENHTNLSFWEEIDTLMGT